MVYVSRSSCTSASAAARVLFSRLPGENPCNYFRLELYLPSFGKVKMLTQYPQIAWGNCLEVRRRPAAGVFDNLNLDMMILNDFQTRLMVLRGAGGSKGLRNIMPTHSN